MFTRIFSLAIAICAFALGNFFSSNVWAQEPSATSAAITKRSPIAVQAGTPRVRGVDVPCFKLDDGRNPNNFVFIPVWDFDRTPDGRVKVQILQSPPPQLNPESRTVALTLLKNPEGFADEILEELRRMNIVTTPITSGNAPTTPDQPTVNPAEILMIRVEDVTIYPTGYEFRFDPFTRQNYTSIQIPLQVEVPSQEHAEQLERWIRDTGGLFLEITTSVLGERTEYEVAGGWAARINGYLDAQLQLKGPVRGGSLLSGRPYYVTRNQADELRAELIGSVNGFMREYGTDSSSTSELIEQFIKPLTDAMFEKGYLALTQAQALGILNSQDLTKFGIPKEDSSIQELKERIERVRDTKETDKSSAGLTIPVGSSSGGGAGAAAGEKAASSQGGGGTGGFKFELQNDSQTHVWDMDDRQMKGDVKVPIALEVVRVGSAAIGDLLAFSSRLTKTKPADYETRSLLASAPNKLWQVKKVDFRYYPIAARVDVEAFIQRQKEPTVPPKGKVKPLPSHIVDPTTGIQGIDASITTEPIELFLVKPQEVDAKEKLIPASQLTYVAEVYLQSPEGREIVQTLIFDNGNASTGSTPVRYGERAPVTYSVQNGKLIVTLGNDSR